MSSGTTGKPTLSLYTKKDLELSNKALSVAWGNFGVTEKSRVQFIMSYGLFSGAPINTLAIQYIGAFVLPAGIQPISRQLDLMRDFKIDTVIMTPSFLFHLWDYFKLNDIKWSEFSVKTIIVAGEIYNQDLKNIIKKESSLNIFDHYGLCEVNTGIIYECKLCGEMASLKNHVFVEVIDDKGKNVNIGELGELVLTSLEKEATPILRYKTGDIVTYKGESKNCINCIGSTLVSRVSSREGKTIFYKGIKIEPYDLRDVIYVKFSGKILHRIHIEVPENLFIKEPNIKIEILSEQDLYLKKDIEELVYNTFKVKFSVEIVPRGYFKELTTNKDDIVTYVK